MSDEYFELDDKKLADLRKAKHQRQAQAGVTGDIVQEEDIKVVEIEFEKDS